jgi:hypothetical protein
MGMQLPLPAGWAWALASHLDPHARLAELDKDAENAKAKIRGLLDEFAEKYGVSRHDVDLALLSVEDTLADLAYATRTDLEAEIEEERIQIG